MDQYKKASTDRKDEINRILRGVADNDFFSKHSEAKAWLENADGNQLIDDPLMAAYEAFIPMLTFHNKMIRIVDISCSPRMESLYELPAAKSGLRVPELVADGTVIYQDDNGDSDTDKSLKQLQHYHKQVW